MKIKDLARIKPGTIIGVNIEIGNSEAYWIVIEQDNEKEKTTFIKPYAQPVVDQYPTGNFISHQYTILDKLPNQRERNKFLEAKSLFEAACLLLDRLNLHAMEEQ